MWESVVTTAVAGSLALVGVWYGQRSAGKIARDERAEIRRIAREDRAEARRKDQFTRILDVYEQALSLAILKTQTPPLVLPDVKGATLIYARLKLHGSQKAVDAWGQYVKALKQYTETKDRVHWEAAGQATDEFIEEAKVEFERLGSDYTADPK